MAAEWTDRTIRGPTAEYLTKDEVRKLFGFPQDWFDERAKDGTFPLPVSLTAKSHLYTWEHVVFISLWLRLSAGTPRKNPAE